MAACPSCSLYSTLQYPGSHFIPSNPFRATSQLLSLTAPASYQILTDEVRKRESDMRFRQYLYPPQHLPGWGPMAVDLNHAASSFESFFRQWLLNQEEYLQQLLSARHHGGQQRQELESLLSRVLRHYQNYYDEKSRCARVDVLQFFSPPWLTALEKTFLWIGGWKPSMAFRILDNSVGALSPEERRGIEQLRAETRGQELELTEEQAKVQESLGGQTVLEQARRVGRLKDGEGREVEAVLEVLHLSLEVLLEAADNLRVSTVKKIVEILGEVRTVDFLASAAQLHLGIRRKGMQRETGRTGEGEAR